MPGRRCSPSGPRMPAPRFLLHRRWTCAWSARTARRWRLRGGWRRTPRWGGGAAAGALSRPMCCTAVGLARCGREGASVLPLVMSICCRSSACLAQPAALPPFTALGSGAARALPRPGVAPRPCHCRGADDWLRRRGEPLLMAWLAGRARRGGLQGIACAAGKLAGCGGSWRLLCSASATCNPHPTPAGPAPRPKTTHR